MKKILSLLLTITVLLQICGAVVWAADAEKGSSIPASGTSGKCGMNMTWTLTAGGVLTISGTGDMFEWELQDEEYFKETPWFDYITDIRQIVLEEGVHEIGAYAFSGCVGLTEIVIPSSVTAIGKSAFEKCSSLTSVSLPYSWSSTMTIAPFAFACTGLKHISFPFNVVSIGEGAFKGCTSLENIFFESSLPIPAGEKVSVFDGVTADCYYPVYSAEDLNEDVINQYGGNLNWKPVEGAGICGNDLIWTAESLLINPDDPNEGCTFRLSFLGSGAMWDFEYYAKPWEDKVEAVSEVVLNEGLTHIGANAFYWASHLTEVTIPASVTSIGEGAFAYSGLSVIRLLGSEPELGVNVFAKYDADTNGITTYAPWASHSSDQWGTIIQVAPSDTAPPVLNVTGPSNGSLLTNLFVTFAVTASDTSGVSSVEMSYQKGTETITVTEALYTINLAELGDGSLTVTFTAKDIVGNTTSQTFSYIVDVYPDTPTGLTALVTPEGILLSWTEPENSQNIEGYYIYLEGEYGNLIYKSYITKGTSMWTDTDVQYGSTYSYRIAAEASNQMMSAYSDAVTIAYVQLDTESPFIVDVWPAEEDRVTLCHDGTLQLKAKDNVGLSHAEFYYENTLIGTAAFDADGIASVKWDCSALSGEHTLTYKAYDHSGNEAEQTAAVIIRPYTVPAVPEQVTVENSFRSATLNWKYTGDTATLKQFNIYDGGEGGMLVAAVKDYKFIIRDLNEALSYRIAAVDIYGAESFCTDIITATPVLTENEPPSALVPNKTLIGVTGTPITFSGALSTDNDCIVSYIWNFGDGSTGEDVYAEHTYYTAGNYSVSLTVTDRSGNTNSTTVSVTIVDTLGADATHAVMTVTVMDGYTEGTPAITNATVTVYNGIDFEIAAKTDGNGQAVIVVPKGAHTMTVVKNGFGGKIQQIEVIADDNGIMKLDVYLAQNGVSVVDGQLTVNSMTYEEIVASGIDVNDPANNHVVRQALEIRFRPAAELEFDLNIDVMINAAGKQVGGTGFGWHTFTPAPTPTPDPDRPNPPTAVNTNQWVDPEYSVGVFPVGENAYMVIYGQTHWLKEMFNVELLVFNPSYAEDITDCYAELMLPEGLSLADMLEGQQHQKMKVGNGVIEYINKEVDGDKVGSNVRQVNWYVRGDAEGVYNLTAAVTGEVGGTPFESIFVAEKAIEVFSGKALHLTVTIPKSAYHEKEYIVKYELTNVSDKPIYNLSFGIDSIRQFTVERLSSGEEGGIRDIWDEASFASNKTFALPKLSPGESFCIEFKTKFLYEQEFIEFIFGKIPGAEAGYHAAKAFVTTMDGSTTEIPVTIVLEDIQKMSFGQWIWDEALKELVETVVDTAVDFVDAVFFGGIPVTKGGIKIVKLGLELKDEVDGTDQIYEASVSVGGGVQCVTEEAAAEFSNASTYSLRRSTTPGVLVWTDAEDYEIAADGKSMILRSTGNLHILRVGATQDEPEIAITTKYIDSYGEIREFTRTLVASTDKNTPSVYDPDLKPAKHILMDKLVENTFAVPAGDETVIIRIPAQFIAENGDILMRASNESWTVTDAEGKTAEGMTVSSGMLAADSTARAGIYTVKLALDGTDIFKEQTIVLTQNGSGSAHKCEDENYDHACDFGCDKIIGEHVDRDNNHTCDYGCADPVHNSVYVQQNNQHYEKCTFATCNYEGERAACHGGTASCTMSAVCTICSHPYGTLMPHTPSAQYSHNETHHWRVCTNGNPDCTIKLEYAEHVSGPEATEKSAQYCMVCNRELVAQLNTPNENMLLMLLMLMKQTYSITSEAGEGGMITSAGETTVKFNKSMTYTIIPDEGYVIKSVLVDGKDVGAVSSYTFQNVRKKHTITALFEKLPWVNPYTDVSETDWFYDSVAFVSENNLMNGINKDGKTFDPAAVGCRSMLVTILWRMEGSPVIRDGVKFSDVKENDWFASAVSWASLLGLVEGYGNQYMPNDPITYEQAAMIFYRYAAYKGVIEGTKIGESTERKHSDWAADAVIWAEANGLLSDWGIDISDMTANADRAALAAYLYRFSELFLH